MILGIIILGLSIVLLITTILFIPKLKFWLFPLIGSILLITFKVLPLPLILEELFKHGNINPIEILILFISMAFISTSLDELGLFKFLASFVLSKVKSKQISLFLMLYGLISILTIFTSNDIIILTFTPFIIFFCKHAKLNPIPYLITEFVGANTWSMMFIIGNPTNIYIASYNNIDFLTYFKVMVTPTIIVSLTSFLIIYLLFHKELKKPLVKEEITVHKIEYLPELIICLLILISCIILLALQSFIKIKMFIIAAICAMVVLVTLLISHLIHKKDVILVRSLKDCPWDLVPFVLSMFILTLFMKEYGITDFLAKILGEKGINFTYGYSALFACNIINNIPMSIMYSNILTSVSPLLINQAIYSTIMASNVGAFLTPIGALAGIMWLNILKKNEIHFTFFDFMRYGLIIAIPSLLVGLLVLQIIL